MSTTMATANAILKEVYEKKIPEQINQDTVTIRRIERSSEGVTNEVGGKYVTFPIHTGRNSGIGARTELQALPAAGRQGYVGARVALKYLYGSVQLSGQTLKLADSNFQAFASVLDQEMTGIKDDLAKDLNRQVYGGHNATDNAVISTANATGTTTTFITAGGNQTKYLEIGMVVDVFSSSYTTLRGSATITALSATTATLGTALGSATASGDLMVRSGSGLAIASGGTQTQREITGLGTIVNSSGSLYNINPATASAEGAINPALWAARVDSNSGTNRALSEGLVISNVDAVRQVGAKTSVLFSGLGVRRAYFNLLSQQRKFTNTTTFDGGFSGLAFTTDQGEIPWVVDVDCPNNTVYGLQENQLKVYREADWSFMDLDGSKWQRLVSQGSTVGNFDGYQATMYCYMELATHRRNAHFVIRDITEG